MNEEINMVLYFCFAMSTIPIQLEQMIVTVPITAKFT